MQTYFSLTINGIELDFISMNTSGPKLFQVFVNIDGKRTRFHMKGNGTNTLSFAMPQDCPTFLLDQEEPIRTAIFQLATNKQTSS